MSHVREPRVTLGNYVSYFCSPYYVWFQDLGYPRLDLLQYEDGEWAIVQMLNSPVVPAETQWRAVLSGMRNIEISHSFIRKYVEEIDIQRRAFWDREEAKSELADKEEAALDAHREDMVERAHKAITQNPDLMDRIAKNGIQEMDIRKIHSHIPTHRL